MKYTSVSVIIPTLNRPGYLLNTLKNLLSQGYPDMEVVVVDQSDEPCRNALKECFDCDKDNIKYIHLKEKGLPNARNRGIEVCVNDILLFIDDDVMLGERFVFYHALAHDQKDIGCVAGRVIDPREKPQGSACAGARVLPSGAISTNFGSQTRQYVYAAAGGNSSFSREAVAKTGFFDKRFKGTGVLEDTDYCYRLRKNGYKILFEPRASLVHLAAESGGCRQCGRYRSQYFRLRNGLLFYYKNMNKVFIPYFALASCVRGIRGLLQPARRGQAK